jgi:tetratricopeptide (TPR) repeat protein
MGDASDIATAQRADARRFAAFISYSHADADAAAKLQRRLERYRLPKRVAAARTNSATSLGPIFRDREDLAAAASLSAAIRDAIGRAEALVVMCSPDAASSPWVAAEIELFRELHPDRPILAALLSGEPAVSFPPALTADGDEPLAADLRPEGDGAQLGFLKIVAGIVAVPLDTLIQRDAQRRIRRVTAITASAVTAMLIMAIMTAYAIQARNEAARQRAAAEGLVEYMLTDLREKLKGVNRLDVLSSVNRRAMEHYRGQGDLAKLPADALERRARIMHAMGEDEDRRGQLDQAAEKFREAHRTTGALLSREPENPDRIFSHAQSEYWVGYAAWRKLDLVTTGKYWRGYLSLARRLAEAEPGTVRSLMEMGYAHGNNCDLLMKDKKDVPTAIGHCRSAIGFVRRAFALDSANTKNGMDLANRLGWMADTLIDAGRFDEAIAHREEEQRLIDGLLVKDPQNFELRHRQAWPGTGIGWAEYKQRNFQKAIEHLDSSITLLDKLAHEYPDDQQLSLSQVRTAIMLAMALRDSGNSRWAQARRHAGEVAAAVRQEAKTDGLKRIDEMLVKFDRETGK